VCRKDYGWTVGLVYDSMELSRVTTAMPGVARVLQIVDIMAQDLIGLIEYSYHQGIPSFLEAHLQRTLGLNVFGLEQF
jgi:hypothetical protein